MEEYTSIYYLWGFKRDKNDFNPPMECIYKNQEIISNFKIIYEPAFIQNDLSQFPKLMQLWPKIPHWVVRADIARYILIYLRGGFYCDVDCEFIKRPTLQDQNYSKKTILFIEKILNDTNNLGLREEKKQFLKTRIANYAFGSFIKHSPFLYEVIQECMRRLLIYLTEKRSIYQKIDNISQQDILWLAGPDVVTTVYHYYANKDDIQLLDTSYLYHYAEGTWRK